MQRLKLGRVYPITGSVSGSAKDHVYYAECFMRAGVPLFQVRDKSLEDEAYLGQLTRIRDLSRDRGSLFLVNDRVDLAQACGADGVHLGQTDMPVAEARKLLGPEAVIGISTHTEEQFLGAQELDVDYVAVGPIFPTATKVSPYAPLGVEFLTRMAGRSRFPLVAIGGITIDNALAVWQAGAASVAVISDILCAPVPELRLKEYMEKAPQ